MSSSYFLAIETSCDECSAAVVELKNNKVRVLSNVIFSQIQLHQKYGGIVPEVASRNHLEMISPIIDEALQKAGNIVLSGVIATQGPGLMGALLVGLTAAKAIAFTLKIPLILVDHLEGHLHSLFIDGQPSCNQLTPSHLPILVCLVSGGHTSLYLVTDLPPSNLNAKKISESRDDAAGEAFDKCAKLMGLPYPGGIQIDRLAKGGNSKAFAFPRPLPGQSLEFSFSGLKTSVATQLKTLGFDPFIWGKQEGLKLPEGKLLSDLCASIQEAIVETLVKKISLGVNHTQAKSVAIVGGVSANSRLRECLFEKIKIPIFIPDQKYCTDNAAMIGACGAFKYARNEILSSEDFLKANAYSS